MSPKSLFSLFIITSLLISSIVIKKNLPYIKKGYNELKNFRKLPKSDDSDSSSSGDEEDQKNWNSIKTCRSEAVDEYIHFMAMESKEFNTFINEDNSHYLIEMISNNEKMEYDDSNSDEYKKNYNKAYYRYLERLGPYFFFIAFACHCVFWWALFWICWIKPKYCCMGRKNEDLYTMIIIMISLLCFMGIFACIISGFVYSHRFSRKLDGVKCSTDRFYYNIRYAYMAAEKIKYKFLGLKNITRFLESPSSYVSGCTLNTDSTFTKNLSNAKTFIENTITDFEDFFENKIYKTTKHYISLFNGFGFYAWLSVYSVFFVIAMITPGVFAGYTLGHLEMLKLPLLIMWNICMLFIIYSFILSGLLGMMDYGSLDGIALYKQIFNQSNINYDDSSDIEEENSDKLVLQKNTIKFFKECLLNIKDEEVEDIYELVHYQNFHNVISNETGLNFSDICSQTDNITIQKRLYLMTKSLNCNFMQDDLNQLYSSIMKFVRMDRKLITLTSFISFFGFFGIITLIIGTKRTDTAALNNDDDNDNYISHNNNNNNNNNNNVNKKVNKMKKNKNEDNFDEEEDNNEYKSNLFNNSKNNNSKKNNNLHNMSEKDEDDDEEDKKYENDIKNKNDNDNKNKPKKKITRLSHLLDDI